MKYIAKKIHIYYFYQKVYLTQYFYSLFSQKVYFNYKIINEYFISSYSQDI